MRALRSVVVSSALLFILGAAGMHPASGAETALDTLPDEVRASLLIAEFYPCAVCGDEYLVLSNCGSEAVSLTGWSVTDGEGAIRFLGGDLLAGQSLSVSENASSYLAAYGRLPDIHIPSWSAGDGVEMNGRFRLADAGDGLELVSPDGLTADTVVYGDASMPPSGWSGEAVPSIRTGEVVRRLVYVGARDTDTAVDWTHFREFRYGYSDHGAVSSEVSPGDLTCFTSPDCSLDVVAGVLSDAETSLRLCSYELSSAHVCHRLSEAAQRGVDVHVLVDADPVGGMSLRELACLSALSQEGVDVRVLGGNLDEGVVRHLGALHAKYIVADLETMVALSENFVEDGVPADRLFGNRGWGVSVTDEALSSFMASVFDEDSRLGRPDVWSWRHDPRFDPGAVLPDEVSSAHPSGMLAPSVIEDSAYVSIHLSPDVSHEAPFLQPLISGSHEVSFEQFQADLEWTTRWSEGPVVSPIVDAVGQVLRSGGTARGMLDGSWYNTADNTEVAEYLSAEALAAGVDPSFGFLPEGTPVTTLHNKGLVLDGTCVVSSNNWVYASFARNRELAVAMRSAGASSYFMDAYELDRVPDTCAPVADAGEDVVADVPGVVMLDASGSWDDRAIADISWDFEGDGNADAEGPRAEFAVGAPGTYEVWVWVTDAWGNSATASVNVSVGLAVGADGPSGDAGFRVPWPLPAAVAALAMVLGAARKLNLLHSVTRGKG